MSRRDCHVRMVAHIKMRANGRSKLHWCCVFERRIQNSQVVPWGERSRCNKLDWTICCSDQQNVNVATFHDGNFDHLVWGQEFCVGWRKHHAYSLSRNVESPVVWGNHTRLPKCSGWIRCIPQVMCCKGWLRWIVSDRTATPSCELPSHYINALYFWCMFNDFCKLQFWDSSSRTRLLCADSFLGRARARCWEEVCRTSPHPQHLAVPRKKKEEVSIKVSTGAQSKHVHVGAALSYCAVRLLTSLTKPQFQRAQLHKNTLHVGVANSPCAVRYIGGPDQPRLHALSSKSSHLVKTRFTWESQTVTEQTDSWQASPITVQRAQFQSREGRVEKDIMNKNWKQRLNPTVAGGSTANFITRFTWEP